MSRQHMNETRRMMRLLEEERAVLLTENNFTVDYTDIKYSCKKFGRRMKNILKYFYIIN